MAERIQRAKTVIFVGVNELHNQSFEHLMKDGFYNSRLSFHLVHILNDKSRSQLPPSVDVKDSNAVESYIRNQFETIQKSVFGDLEKAPKVEHVILMNKDTKLQAVNYLKEVEADSCIVATRGEQSVEGVFTESMAYYLVAHAPCDVLVIRPS